MKNQESTYLIDVIQRDNYFQRSVNIDLDKNLIDIINNFYCPISYEQVLVKMIDTIEQSNQSAFTWSGAYGSGKSTLALFLNALLSSNRQTHELAVTKLSETYRDKITCFFNPQLGWQIVNIVGQAINAETLFKQAFQLNENATTEQIFEKLTQISRKKRLVIFIDEMGKLLEAVNRNQTAEDVYFLQQLAEFVSRSQGRIILVGILHQSITAYARQAKRSFNEWQKIQGRFNDLVITLSVDEQLHLISQVLKIASDKLLAIKNGAEFQQIVAKTVSNIAVERNTNSEKLTQVLTDVFPIHPLVAILLSQLSKKDFGQNQRSIFSFLMSAESFGFSYYLKNTPIENFVLYEPSQFWDYIDSNLASIILTTEYAKPWLLAQLAVNRYQVRENANAIKLIKVISLVTMFANDTGLHADLELLQSATGIDSGELVSLLSELQESSLIVYSRFKQGYVFSEGSDFNLTQNIDKALLGIQELPFERLKQFEPIIAKRHYQEKGAFRWVEIKLLPMTSADISNDVLNLAKNTNASLVGYFCILTPTTNDEQIQANTLAQQLAKTYKNFAFTVLNNYVTIIDLLRDSLALQDILDNHPQLINDTLARQETEARLIETEDKINLNLQIALNQSEWFNQQFGDKAELLNIFKLSSLASKIADDMVDESIVCNNELVNRNAPSPNAKGAIRELIRHMIEHGKEENLGIEKFPPERAIYESVLKNNGIHRSDDGENYYFSKPNETSSFYALWKHTDTFLAENEGKLITADKLYAEWQKPPFGVKAGLCDILYIAYVLSRYNDLANYIEGEYKTQLQYLLAEYLLKDPQDVGIREVSRLKATQPWIFILREKLQQEFCNVFKEGIEPEPLPIAQAIIRFFDNLHPWVHRTNELSPSAKQLKATLKTSDDPNKLLFDDLPRFFNSVDSDDIKAETIILALKEMQSKYPDLVNELNRRLFVNFRIIQSNDGDAIITPTQFETINNRANLIWHKSGDNTLEPFISRLRNYQGGLEQAEGLISLLAENKPPKAWIDQDIQKALQRLSDLSYSFLEAEINSDIPMDKDRFQASVIVKIPSKAPEVKNITIERKTQVTPDSAKIIRKAVESIRQSDAFKKLDNMDKVATIAELFQELATQ